MDGGMDAAGSQNNESSYYIRLFYLALFFHYTTMYLRLPEKNHEGEGVHKKADG